jgi:hypothetical protein
VTFDEEREARIRQDIELRLAQMDRTDHDRNPELWRSDPTGLFYIPPNAQGCACLPTLAAIATLVIAVSTLIKRR